MKLFLSHSSADKEIVRSLASALKANEVDVWFDEWEIRWGDSLTDKIQNGIEGSSFLVAVISSNSVRSNWVNLELKAAITTELSRNSVFILPIIVDNCDVPLFLRDKLYIDFRGDFGAGIAKVLAAVASYRGTPAHLGPVLRNAMRAEQDLSPSLVQELAAGIGSLDLGQAEYEALLDRILRTDVFLLPFLEYGQRYHGSAYLLKKVLSARELPHPQHAEYTLQLAEGKSKKTIGEYAGFSSKDSESSEDSEEVMKDPTTDEERKTSAMQLRTVDMLGVDHKSGTVLEVLRNLYRIGNRHALDLLVDYAGFSLRIMTPSITLLLNTGNVKALAEYLSRVGSYEVSDVVRNVVYRSLANLADSRREHLQLLTAAFATSKSHAQFRLLEHLDAFERRSAVALCSIGKSSESHDIKTMSIEYLNG